jgi:hypothetical protein
MKRHGHLLIRLQNMSTPTTTIRVPIETRDRLAEQARTRGVSIAALLTELASRTDREAILKAEREATRADATKTAVRDEAADWDDTVNDGLDIE